MTELNKLAADVHQRNVTAGWWTNLTTGEDIRGYDENGVAKRNVPELLCLVHSEITEAWEGFVENLNDDKLPDRKMIEVELADAQIRMLDIAGAFNVDLDGAYAEAVSLEFSMVSQALCDIHRDIDRAMEGYRKNKSKDGRTVFEREIGAAYKHIDELGTNLLLDVRSALTEKLEFNANRADHKVENRLLADGKKF